MQEHRHSFVRKNAVFAVYSIYQSFDYLIPDAPELVQTFLAAETDVTCKRNAFVTLVNLSPVRAIEYLMQIYDAVGTADELMQLAVIELIRKDREGKGEGGKEELKVTVGQLKVRRRVLIPSLPLTLGGRPATSASSPNSSTLPPTLSNTKPPRPSPP